MQLYDQAEVEPNSWHFHIKQTGAVAEGSHPTFPAFSSSLHPSHHPNTSKELHQGLTLTTSLVSCCTNYNLD